MSRAARPTTVWSAFYKVFLCCPIVQVVPRINLSISLGNLLLVRSGKHGLNPYLPMPFILPHALPPSVSFHLLALAAGNFLLEPPF